MEIEGTRHYRGCLPEDLIGLCQERYEVLASIVRMVSMNHKLLLNVIFWKRVILPMCLIGIVRGSFDK